MKYIGYLYAKLGGKYLKISHTDIFEELKRLQKEIDDAEVVLTDNTISHWGFGLNHNYTEDEVNKAFETKEQNQLKIKQIIESL